MAEDDFFDNFDGTSGKSSSEEASVAAPEKQAPKSAASRQEPRLPMTRGMVVTIVLLAFIALSAIVCGILAATKQFGWEVWQYIIGIDGGLAAIMAFGIVIYWLDEKDILHYDYPVLILVLGATIANFVLRCYFTDAQYKVIFICLGIMLTALTAFYCFHLIDPPLILTMGVGCACAIALLISGWIMPSWTVWQWIIGGMVSLLFLAPIFVMEYKGEFIRYALSLILSVAMFAVNFILMRKFQESYKIIFIWLSTAGLIASLLSVGVRHAKGDGAWGKVSIVPLVGGAILLVLGLVL